MFESSPSPEQIVGRMDGEDRTNARAPSGGYPRKRARTRRVLLNAAMGVLAERGPDGATVGEIARRAQVAPGTFYNHFDDLATITSAVVDELAAGVEIERDQLAAIEHDAAARVAIGARQLLDLARTSPETARAFLTLLASVPTFRARIRTTVLGAITDGIDQGRFDDRPSEVTADAVLGATTQWMRSILAGEAGGTPDADYLGAILHIAGAIDHEDAARIAGSVAAHRAG